MFRAAVLAAGEGSRLKAQGIFTPKPLVPIKGMPMMERILRQLQAVGAREVTCIINEDSPEVQTHLQKLAIGIPIRTVVKSTPSSFHSLCQVLPFLQGEPFLLSLVDSIFETTELGGFVRYALKRRDLDGLFAVTDFVEDESPLRVELGEGNRVVAVGRGATRSPYVTGGVYWFSEKILDPALQARQMGLSRLRNFLALLLRQGYTLEGYRFGRIVDVDTAEDIKGIEQRGGW